MSSSSLVCNEVYDSVNGSITSPNFPNNYPNNTHCRYLIKSWDPTTRIAITFLQLRIEFGKSCEFDSLKIYNGDNTNATLLGGVNGICGDTPFGPLTSTGNPVLIVFNSNGNVTYSGFLISYRALGMF